uniref:Ctr_O3_2 conopeptide n=1 Tax=Conus tribblei TaxID=101761 RepID=A0A0K8TUH9_CONTD
MSGTGVALLGLLLLLSLVTNLQGGGGQTMHQDKHRLTVRTLFTLGRAQKRQDPCYVARTTDDCTGTQVCCTPPGENTGNCQEKC